MIGADPSLDSSGILKGLATTDPEMLTNIINSTTQVANQSAQTKLAAQLVPTEAAKNIATANLENVNANWMLARIRGRQTVNGNGAAVEASILKNGGGKQTALPLPTPGMTSGTINTNGDYTPTGPSADLTSGPDATGGQ